MSDPRAPPRHEDDTGTSSDASGDAFTIHDAGDAWPAEDEDDGDYAPYMHDESGAEIESLLEDELEDALEDADFHDAEESLGDIGIEFEITDDSTDNADEDGDGEGNETETERSNRPREEHVYITREQIMQLLGHAGLRRIFANHSTGNQAARFDDDDDEDSEPDTGYGGVGPRRRRGRGRKAFQKVPSDTGRQLMDSGTFGANDRPEDSYKRKKKLAYRLMARELGRGCPGRQKAANNLISQCLIPSSRADTIIHYDARCYSGQFSNDGNFFFSCAQDFRVRMYDTSNPYNWKYYKTVDYPYGQWTITDASLSPDNRYLAYSSIRSIVCLAPTDPNDNSEPHLLDFSNTGSRGRRGDFHSYPYFGIWSLRFSGDGREIVAGTGDRSVYVYDIERRQSILRIPGHEDDVNAVCYGDANSPHILYSGSDDTTLKVWDRRSMGDSREAGVFLGHTEGLTYVDSKGDGRYVLSNGKDQTAKLWDLRNMMSTRDADKIDPNRYTTGFEYRTNAYDESDYRPHPHDRSLVTFRGHSVLKTLIRCHFSPPGSTDSRYVYSGSYDGSVYVWNMDATIAGKVDVLKATKNSRPRDADLLAETYDFIGRNGGTWQTCVRDASWHPNAPVIAATSWNGWGTSLGTCTVHTWNDDMEDDEGEPPMGQRVNAQLDHDEHLYGSADSRRGTSIFSRNRNLRRT
ncbi:WD40 repeat-like protein [Saccharata proteae CBS 121410]|uniref:WD40 repeat-like protein n=1 Tax=Saccharata proteae CBS 121410 TaxID=1314787 RepID=A0A9P4LYC0_9PEZI|nr:WD40 repeat-like protein [Saccharata proteae CBS 121410]